MTRTAWRAALALAIGASSAGCTVLFDADPLTRAAPADAPDDAPDGADGLAPLDGQGDDVGDAASAEDVPTDLTAPRDDATEDAGRDALADADEDAPGDAEGEVHPADDAQGDDAPGPEDADDADEPRDAQADDAAEVPDAAPQDVGPVEPDVPVTPVADIAAPKSCVLHYSPGSTAVCPMAACDSKGGWKVGLDASGSVGLLDASWTFSVIGTDFVVNPKTSTEVAPVVTIQFAQQSPLACLGLTGGPNSEVDLIATLVINGGADEQTRKITVSGVANSACTATSCAPAQ